MLEDAKMLTFARTALKNLFSRPATVGYPYEPAKFPQRMRGHIEIQTENCIRCGLCMRSCPPGAIRVDKAAGTWTINRFDCIQCGSCAGACPKKCLSLVPGYTEPDYQKKEEVFYLPEKAPAAKPAQTVAKPAETAVSP